LHALKGFGPFGRAGPLAVLVARVEVGHEIVVVLLDQADLVHEADERAHRERAAAEAEQKELVVRLEVVDDEAVEVADVVFDAGAERAARELVQRAARAEAVVIEDDLIDAVAIARAHGARDLRDVRRTALAGGLVDLVPDVPRAIGADHQALHRGARLFF
jgi:hypothetical protein